MDNNSPMELFRFVSRLRMKMEGGLAGVEEERKNPVGE